MGTVSTAIILDTRKALKDGTYPVKLRLTHQRKQKYYPLNDSLTKEDFARVFGDRPRGDYKEKRLVYNAVEQRAESILKKISLFTFEAFEKQFLNKYVSNDVFSAFTALINRLKNEDRAGTASSNECAMKSIQDFTKTKSLPFSIVTPDFLDRYEKWMVTNGKSITTVGIYLRALRALFNDAIATGDIPSEVYPFGKRKFQIPAGRNVKKALGIKDIEKLYNYVPENMSERKARDFWIFSYLCNGINMKDIALLTNANIKGDKIIFIRAKTKRTSRQNLKPVVAIVTPEAQRIIDYWRVEPAQAESFVFPILTKGDSSEVVLGKVRALTKSVNTYLKKIAKKVGIEANVSTYAARHSFSTILKRSGAPIEFISEALGHNDMRTTESYLDSFEDTAKRQYTTQLTAFGE